MKKINLKIGGMSCSACSNGLEKYLNKQTGVISASVNLVMANALIEYDESVLNRKKIEKNTCIMLINSCNFMRSKKLLKNVN